MSPAPSSPPGMPGGMPAGVPSTPIPGGLPTGGGVNKYAAVAIIVIILGVMSLVALPALMFGAIESLGLWDTACKLEVLYSWALSEETRESLQELCEETGGGEGQYAVGGRGGEFTGTSGLGQGVSYESVGGQCFPVSPDSLKYVSWNFGNRRSKGARCHAGVDIYTKKPGNIVAIADGVVKNIYNFYKCKSGWAGPGQTIAIIVDHGDYTVNYGEIDSDKKANIKIGDNVKAGQFLGQAGRCGMIHFELYQGDVSANKQWYPPKGSSVGSTAQYCVSNYLSTKPSALLDPTNVLKGLQANNVCGQKTQSKEVFYLGSGAQRKITSGEMTKYDLVPISDNILSKPGSNLHISRQVNDMIINAYNSCNGCFKINSAFRSNEHQTYLYNTNCPKGKCTIPTAKPGQSNHQQGKAVDVNGVNLTCTNTGGSKCDKNIVKALEDAGLKHFKNCKTSSGEYETGKDCVHFSIAGG